MARVMRDLDEIKIVLNMVHLAGSVRPEHMLLKFGRKLSKV